MNKSNLKYFVYKQISFLNTYRISKSIKIQLNIAMLHAVKHRKSSLTINESKIYLKNRKTII